MEVTSSTTPQTTTETLTPSTSTTRSIKELSTKHHATFTSDQTTERGELTTPRTQTTLEVRTSQSTQSFFTKHQSSFSYTSAKPSKSTHKMKNTTTDGKYPSTSSIHSPVEASSSKHDISSATTFRPISSPAVITNRQKSPATSTKVNISAPRQKIVSDKVSY